MFHSVIRLRLLDDPKSWTSIAAPLEPIFYESLDSTFWPSTIADSCPNMFRTDFEGMRFTHFAPPIFGNFFENAKILQQLPSNPMHVIDNKIFRLWSCELALKGSNSGTAQAGGILFLRISPYRQFHVVLECHGDCLGQSSSVRGQSSQGENGYERMWLCQNTKDNNLKTDWFFQEKISSEPQPGWLELCWIMQLGDHSASE